MVKRGAHGRRPAGWRKFIWIGLAVAVLAISGIGVGVFAGRTNDDAVQKPIAASRSESALRVVEVHKDPTCGCCSKWAEHLQAHGFTVRTNDDTDMAAFKSTHGVPRSVQSCHTALVHGYVIEGHVPAADVQRLLDERPGLAGLAVAGMPIGSPGMEVPGVKPQRYDVVAFEKGGATRVFATHE